jgi:spermidine/putrescine transport system permease protein
MIGNVIENQFRGSARDWPFGAALGVSLLAAFVASFWLSERLRGARPGG